MPAHITVVFPFLPADRLTDEVLTELRGLCGEVGDLAVTFTRTSRLPGLLWLDPEPTESLKQLTVAIVRRWPEAPRYGGAVDDEVVPHLTVAYADGDALDAVETDIKSKLPLPVTLTEARLYVFERGRWLPRVTLPFQRSRA